MPPQVHPAGACLYGESTVLNERLRKRHGDCALLKEKVCMRLRLEWLRVQHRVCALLKEKVFTRLLLEWSRERHGDFEMLKAVHHFLVPVCRHLVLHQYDDVSVHVGFGYFSEKMTRDIQTFLLR